MWGTLCLIVFPSFLSAFPKLHHSKYETPVFDKLLASVFRVQETERRGIFLSACILDNDTSSDAVTLSRMRHHAQWRMFASFLRVV